ncbi:MAG TPA: methyl-accepting chemotaxis protein [Geobacterales bacterium]|nr:methyl-accepting chemotaxis protein [Geobacterales bacterium]
MRIWRDLKVQKKILTLVAGGCFGLIIVGGLGLYAMKQTSEGIAEANQSLGHAALLADMKSSFLLMRLDLAYMMSATDIAVLHEKQVSFRETASLIGESVEGFRSMGITADENAKVDLFSQGVERYVLKGERLVKLCEVAARSGNLDDRRTAYEFARIELAPLYGEAVTPLDALINDNVTGSQAMYQNDMANYRRTFATLVGIIIAVTILSMVAGLAIARSIANPLGRVLGLLKRVAAGDLTARLPVQSTDEMGELTEEVNQMAERLHSTLSQVAQNASQVASAASQLFATSDQMAAGAEEVAAQATTVATSAEEMAATSNDIAQNCFGAAQSATEAGDAATSGAAVVSTTITVMNRIADRVKTSAQTVDKLGSHSEQIGEIVGVIEDIADQTNLLALNAAIEAARAGEQGRGFAVVADEVRALAERTTKATKEIGQMIKGIQGETKRAVISMEEGVQEVESGTQEASRSGVALDKILQVIGSLSGQVNQIATAAEEQTATTSEISNNMQQITGVVQETARGAQESASAASQLSTLAEELQRLVGNFKLVA